ncbi:hypothetical protein KY285_022797 [Solanum tuberosum]|nr:hypothetical protein KY285_022797 [Solanum tuberosum]
MYNGCKGFSIYYKLPTDDGGLFNMLSAAFTVEWKLSEDCYKCHYGGGQCQTDITNKFHCSYPNNPHAHQGHQENDLNAQDAKMTRSKLGLILGAGAVLFTVGLLVLLFYFREKILWYKYIRFWESNAQDHQNIEAFLKNYGSCSPKRYNYLEVKRITSGIKNKLGQGGYGSVYKGCLHNGSHVAVKVLKKLKGSGEEFINELWNDGPRDGWRKKNVDVGVDRTSEIYFPHWLYRRIELDEELQLIGTMNEEEKECARKMVMASLWCIQTDPSSRPSMSKVVEMLEGKLDSLQMPSKPYLYSPSRTDIDSSVLELA